MKRQPRLALGALVAGLAATAAHATWSIIIVDTRTGEIAVGSATCLENFDLRNGTAILLPGIGAATAQSFLDTSGQNRVFVRDRIIDGTAPGDIIAQLASFDSGHQTRQYGIVDVLGRAATFSGTGAGAWAGGEVGADGDLVFAVQGNVLTGQPVVTAAVQAILDTPGDLAAKLMASMEAARSMGGDGRCSCSGSPTGCGSPPPNFTKSAHIAYMLIARLGDRSGGNGLYRAGAGAARVAAGDIDGDGLLDIASANPNANTISVQFNTTRPASPEPTFTSLPLVVSSPTQPVDVAVADVTGDGLADVISVQAGSATLTIRPGRADRTLGAASTLPLGTGPTRVIAHDLDGDGLLDLLVPHQTSRDLYIFRALGGGDFAPAVVVPLNADVREIIPADINRDGRTDLVMPARDADAVFVLFALPGGGWERGQNITVGRQPESIAVADFNNDGFLDIAAGSQLDTSIRILRGDGQGGFVPQPQVNLLFVPQMVLALELSGDHLPDLLGASTGRMVQLTNSGSGFSSTRSYTYFDNAFNPSFRSIKAADLDNDGDLDLFFSNANHGGIAVVRNLGRAGRLTPPADLQGIFNNGIGCGTGDYYMNFNVANQTQASPDPVITLRNQFNSWRNGLNLRPDAVRSTVEFDRDCIPVRPGGGGEAVMTIRLRDWRDVASTSPVRVEHAPHSDGLSSIGPVVPQGGGVYTVTLTAGSELGRDAFWIVTNESVRPVVLMPIPEIALARSADFNEDGQVDFFDYLDFVAAFAADAPSADFNGDGQIDFFDYLDFVQAFAGGCG